MSNTFAGFLDEWKKLGIIQADAPLPAAKPVDSAEIIQGMRMARFRSICPLEFQKTIKPELVENEAAWNEADKWAGGYPGLWLWSYATGMAKTRMLWRQFGRLHVKQGKTVARISGMNLAEDYHDHFNKSRTGEFYAQFSKLNVVMLDDLDKMLLPSPDQGFAEQAIADRNARMLRELFDRFYEWHTPVLITANEPISHFAERIGPSCERRMREVCREVDFSHSP